MPKLLTAIMIFLWIAPDCYSTNISTTDTLIPVQKRFLENALRMRDSFQLLKKEHAIQTTILDTTTAALLNCDKTEKKYDSLDAVHRLSTINFMDQLKNADRQQIVLVGLNNGLKRELKRKNWAIVKLAGVSVAVAGTLTYLLIK